MNVMAGLCLFVGCFAVFLAGWVWRLDPRSWSNRIVGASLAAYAFWAFWSAMIVVATDAEGFLLSHQMAVLGSVALHPLGVGVVVSAVKPRRPWAWTAVLSSATVSGVAMVLSLSDWPVALGYWTSEWGNVGLPAPRALGTLVIVISSMFSSLIEVILVVWKWKSTESRRYRSAIALFLGVGALSHVLSFYTFQVFWHDLGYPNVTVLARFPILLLYWILIFRYRFLQNWSPEVDEVLFRSLAEPLCLVDPSGRIREATPGFARVLGRTEGALRHRPLGEALEGWPLFGPLWDRLVRNRPLRQEMAGTREGHNYTLELEPLVDRFGDLTWVLVSLRPMDDLSQALEGYRLSDRERQVGSHLVNGLSRPEIAQLLGISPATVKNHVHSLFQKTSTTNRLDLVRSLLRPSRKGEA